MGIGTKYFFSDVFVTSIFNEDKVEETNVIKFKEKLVSAWKYKVKVSFQRKLRFFWDYQRRIENILKVVENIFLQRQNQTFISNPETPLQDTVVLLIIVFFSQILGNSYVSRLPRRHIAIP